jgi:hypothetical protein
MYARLINFKYQQPLKIDGSDQWIGKYKYDEVKKWYLVTIMNKDSGRYLAWKDLMVVMSDDECWWNLFTQQDQFALRPWGSGSESMKTTEFGYSLQMEADYSVDLQFQLRDPVDAALWMLSDN